MGKIHHPRFGNNGGQMPQSRIPPQQLKAFQCECGDAVFEVVRATVFLYDRLDPDKMFPQPSTVYRCFNCGGLLKKTEKDGWHIVHVAGEGERKDGVQESEGSAEDGDEE